MGSQCRWVWPPRTERWGACRDACKGSSGLCMFLGTCAFRTRCCRRRACALLLGCAQHPVIACVGFRDACQGGVMDPRGGMQVVAHAADVQKVVAVCCGSDLLKSALPTLLEQLELCQKSLTAYLEAKRAEFPR